MSSSSSGWVRKGTSKSTTSSSTSRSEVRWAAVGLRLLGLPARLVHRQEVRGGDEHHEDAHADEAVAVALGEGLRLLGGHLRVLHVDSGSGPRGGRLDERAEEGVAGLEAGGASRPPRGGERVRWEDDLRVPLDAEGEAAVGSLDRLDDQGGAPSSLISSSMALTIKGRDRPEGLVVPGDHRQRLYAQHPGQFRAFLGRTA